MNSRCPLCDLPKPETYSVCAYCHQAGKRLRRTPHPLYRRLNVATLLLASIIGVVGFWKVFIAPGRSARASTRMATRQLSPEKQAKCADLRAMYNEAANGAMLVRPGDGRVTRRMQRMKFFEAQMKKLGCPGEL